MRRCLLRSSVAVATIVLSLGLLGGKALSLLAHRASGCPAEATVRMNLPEAIALSDVNSNTVHPQKVVVRPWKGRHHVFGVFELPENVPNSSPFKVHIPGVGTFCGSLNVRKGGRFSTAAGSGKQMYVGYLRTRTALWVTARGKYSQLRHPSNWQFESKV